MSSEKDTFFGETIKKAIKDKGLSYAAVASKMGLPRQSIHRLDLRKTFDLDFLQKLKLATGLDYTNYIFNPKSRNYEPLKQSSLLQEPAGIYATKANTIEMSLSIKINADEDSLSKLSDLISSFKGEANKYGFTLK